eukprot:6212166-Pleurochrysis_carterae.AAC.1
MGSAYARAATLAPWDATHDAMGGRVLGVPVELRGVAKGARRRRLGRSVVLTGWAARTHAHAMVPWLAWLVGSEERRRMAVRVCRRESLPTRESGASSAVRTTPCVERSCVALIWHEGG